MAEFIERDYIDNILDDYIIGHPLCIDRDAARAVKEKLASIPAADVAPVVRCKECRHRDPEDHKCDSGEMERQGCPFPVHDDYFCAYGEKMDEEEK